MILSSNLSVSISACLHKRSKEDAVGAVLPFEVVSISACLHKRSKVYDDKGAASLSRFQ